MSPLPSLSEVENASWDYLTTAAANWTKLAQTWEQTFTEVRNQSMHPGGTEWTGTAADTAQGRTDGDMMRVRDPGEQLRNAAQIAERGREQQEASKRSVLSTVDDTRRGGFNVAQDYKVTDTQTDWASPEEYFARQEKAKEQQNYIKSQVGWLVDGEDGLSRNLTAATQGLDTFNFGDAGLDGGAGAFGVPHDATLVDDVLKPGESRNLGPVAGTGAHPGIPGIGAADLGEVVTLSNGQKVAIFGDAWTGNRVDDGKHYPSVAVPVTFDAQGHPHYGPPLTGTERSGHELFKLPDVAKNAGATNTLPAGTIRMGNGDTYMMVAGTTVENGRLIPKGGSWLVKVDNDFSKPWEPIPNSWNKWEPTNPLGAPTQISGFQSSKDGMVYIVGDSFDRSQGVTMYRFDPSAGNIANHQDWQPWTGNSFGTYGQTPAMASGPGETYGELSFQEVGGKPALAGFNNSSGPGEVQVRISDSPTGIFTDSTPTVVAHNDPGHAPTSVWQPYGGYILPGSTLDNMNILVSQWDTRPASDGAPYNSQEFQVNPYP